MGPTLPIDYTNKDFDSLRQALLDFAQYRLPEWTDRSPGDLGMLFVDLFAYMGDVILYYQDRIANESFLATATERRSVLQLLRLIGYELKPPVAASADLTLVFTAPAPDIPAIAVIPNGAQFGALAPSGATLTFEYLGPDLSLDLNSENLERADRDPATGAYRKRIYRNLPVRHSRLAATVGDPETLGSSTGLPNQAFSLAQGPLIVETLSVLVDEGAGPVPWEQRSNWLYNADADGRVAASRPDSRHYVVEFDENDVAWVVFGDGVFGRIPAAGANNVQATYRVGGGTVGNVPAGAIATSITRVDGAESVANPQPAAGGADHESIDHAVRFGPLAFRSAQRAVTLDDYITLAYQAGGVAKVRAYSSAWNRTDLYIAPEGDTLRPAPEDLKNRLLSYFEDKRMVGNFVYIHDGIPLEIDIGMDVTNDRRYRADAVRQAAENAVQNLLAFRNVDFGQPVYLSDVYGAVETLPGVVAVNVTRFGRRQAAAPTSGSGASGPPAAASAVGQPGGALGAVPPGSLSGAVQPGGTGTSSQPGGTGTSSQPGGTGTSSQPGGTGTTGSAGAAGYPAAYPAGVPGASGGDVWAAIQTLLDPLVDPAARGALRQQLQGFLQPLLHPPIESDGRIEAGSNEIPTLGSLVVNVVEGDR